jgi:hypothetical protein
MSIIKTALVAASFVVVAAAAANAQGREDLNSRFHGEAAVEQSYNIAPRAAYTQNARGAYAQAHANHVRPQAQVQQQEANPLFDDFHGND